MLADDLLTKGHENEYMFKKWLIRIFKRWHWFVISLIACLVLAFLYLSLTTPTYQAVASLMVKDETKGGELVDDRKLQELGLTSSSKLVVNEIEILKSYDLMQIVVDSLQLYTAVHRAGLLRDEPIFGNEIPFILQVDNPEAISIVRHWTITDSSKVLRCKIQSEADPFPVQFGYQYAVAGIRFRIFNNPDYINTVAGKGLIQEYKIDVIPRNEVVIQYSRALLVDPANKLSSVINLEIRDNNQIRATSVLRSLVSIYNRRGLDKRN